MKDDVPLPEINIGMIGHVDHGKTTLVAALSGVWTDRHSEELKRGISIRLGYADTTFRKCPKCESPYSYTVERICPRCGSETEVLRTVSFVDSPGHETLMATMLSGAALMDGAVLVIAANEKCPRPQTKEHLMALEIIGVDKIVIAQNKIDIVSKERLLENYREINEFVKGTIAENAPIIPISAQQKVNLDALIEAIEECIPTPERDLEASPLMHVARSFDVNKPGTPPEKLIGGVVGGSLSRGKLRVGDEITIRPGIKDEKKGVWEELHSEVVGIMASGKSVEEATPGGLIGVATKLDPYLTKSDALVGNVLGKDRNLPGVLFEFTMDVKLLERVVGTEEELVVEKIKMNEPLMLSIGTAITLGVVTSARDDIVEVKLKRPVCAERGWRVAISRRVGSRWRLIGAGTIK
ncbi:MAG: translation initiation factor IF-2 subunit gamma [Archaeoglobus sp.]|jgi:translation initiation factor 2 subunit 3|nr:MAG: translation initiation factor IF-2 subunit gamma [Archaeoglobus sp.]